MSIKATVTFYNSKVDTFGNCYWAFHYHEHETKKDVYGKSGGGDSNLGQMVAELHPDANGRANWNEVVVHRTELGIRKFDKMVKMWEYAGSGDKELAAWVKNELGRIEPCTCNVG